MRDLDELLREEVEASHRPSRGGQPRIGRCRRFCTAAGVCLLIALVRGFAIHLRCTWRLWRDADQALTPQAVAVFCFLTE